MYSGQIILLFFSLMVIITVIITSIKRSNSANTIYGVYLSSLLYYCIIPLLIYCFPSEIEHGSFVNHVLKADVFKVLKGCFCFHLFIFSVAIAHKKSYNRTLNKVGCLDSGLFYRSLLKKFIAFCSIVGILCFVGYIMAFGGVEKMLAESEMVRSFSGEAAISYADKILLFPARLVVLVPVFLAMYMGATKKSGLSINLYFMFSVLLGLLFYVNNAGKTGVAIYLAALLIPILYSFSNNAWKILLLVGLVSAPLVGFLDNLFLYFTTGVFYDVEGSSLLDFITQFAYPASNMLSLDGICTISGYRFGADFFTSVVSQIPGINFPLSFQFTSQYYGGKWWKEGGGTPTDSITFGYMQFWYIGVVVWGFIIGSLSGWTDALFKKIKKGFGNDFFKATLILAFFVLTTNADIYIIIRSQFTFWIPLLFLKFLIKKYYKKNNYSYGK